MAISSFVARNPCQPAGNQCKSAAVVKKKRCARCSDVHAARKYELPVDDQLAGYFDIFMIHTVLRLFFVDHFKKPYGRLPAHLVKVFFNRSNGLMIEVFK